MDGELEPGARFAGCRIEAVAGRGGMGVVYRATELALGRPVALKVVAPARAADPTFGERFGREARLAAAIEHPNVVPVYAAGEEDGRLFLVMRHVEGTDLHRLLRDEGRLAPARAAAIVEQVAAGLDAAHAAGLVHRDVKPANVLIGLAGGREHVYLTDFGLTVEAASDTRLTTTGQWIGTVDFMSPEQLRGQPVDARADVYALGAVLHAALTGEPPFRRATAPDTIAAHLSAPPPRPSAVAGVDAAFDAVVGRALAKRPEDRYPSAGDLARAAGAAARGERVTTDERVVARGPAAPGGDATAAVRRVETNGSGDEATSLVRGRPAGGAGEGEATSLVRGRSGGEDATSLVRGRRAGAGEQEDATALVRGRPGAAGADDATALVPGRAAAAGGGEATAHVRPRAAGAAARAGAAGAASGAGAPPEVVAAARRRRARRRVAGVGLLVLALAGAGALVSVLAGGGPSTSSTAPLSADDVRGAAQDFAAAYGDEDPGALRAVLARDVRRVTPDGVQQGRTAVTAVYRRQFAADDVRGYALSDVSVRPGEAGRAAGRYTVDRAGAPDVTGRIVFGVVREAGRPRIALLAATPDA